MLYGTNAQSESASDRDPEAIPGLGALKPHSANTTTGGSSGGTLGVAGAGNTGGVPAGSQPFGVTQGGGFRGADRNTITFVKGKGAVVSRQPAQNAARTSVGQTRLSPISSISLPIASAVGDDLEGLAGGIGSFLKRALTPPKSRENIIKAALVPVTGGLSLAAPSRWLKRPSRPRREEPPSNLEVMPGIRPLDNGVGDLGLDFGGFFKRALTPPRDPANITKVLLAPFTAGLSLAAPRRMFTTPILSTPIQAVKTGVRYAGLATQTVLFPVLTGSQQRRIFGLNATESAVAMKGQQVFRAIDAAVLTAGAAYYMSPSYQYAGATYYTEAAHGAAPGFTQAGVQVGGSSAAFPTLVSEHAPAGLMGTSGLVSKPAAGAVTKTVATTAAKDSLGVLALKGTGTVLATVATTAGTQMLLAQKPQDPIAVGQSNGGPVGAPSPLYGPTEGAGQASAGGGGMGEAPIEAGSLGLVVPVAGGIGVTLLVNWLMSRRSK